MTDWISPVGLRSSSEISSVDPENSKKKKESSSKLLNLALFQTYRHGTLNENCSRLLRLERIRRSISIELAQLQSSPRVG